MEFEVSWEDEIGNRKNGFVHHSYVLFGFELSELKEFLKREFKISFRNNPDVHEWQHERFYLDDAHDLITEASTRAFREDAKKIFLIDSQIILRESQNALLKTIEEPPADTYFFFLLPSESSLLSTIRSRVQCITNGRKNIRDVDALLAKQFAHASPAERISLISPIILEKDKQRALRFLNALESYLHEPDSFQTSKKGDLEIFDVIRKARGYLSDTAPSVKMLLENISLTLPEDSRVSSFGL